MTLEIFAVFIGSSIRLSIPLVFAATGEVVSEMAGVLNMSIEGMMLTGAFVGALGARMTGDPWLGLLIGVAGTVPVALLQAFLSNMLRVDQIVTGIGINIFALGATTLAYRETFGAASRYLVPGFDRWAPPVLGGIPVLGDPIFHQVWMAYFAIPVVIVTAWVLRRTSLGLAIRAVGADPQAVDQAGISVTGVRIAAVLFAGVMAALGGAYLSIGDIHTFTEGMTNGIGYLAIVAVIFGNWRLWRTVGACLLFGMATALQFELPDAGFRLPVALLIMTPYLLALIAVAGLAGRQTPPGALTLPYARTD
jgi:general nucleoside transport system permease protein